MHGASKVSLDKWPHVALLSCMVRFVSGVMPVEVSGTSLEMSGASFEASDAFFLVSDASLLVFDASLEVTDASSEVPDASLRCLVPLGGVRCLFTGV